MNLFKKITFLSIFLIVLLNLGCGTNPQIRPGDVHLEIEGNEPNIYIVPPEEPEGNERVTITEHHETHDGLWRSYNEHIEYDNITIYREIEDISYYSYWRYGLVKSYEEKRSFEPSGICKNIEVNGCLYNHGRKLINYEAIVNGIPYYFAGEFNPDSADYSDIPAN
ncbi:hypothetical protein KAH81_04770 [bacterium]|nr:hypothetical protein [bacterium]